MPRGGRRPGAGAPRGNMNAIKHGKYSARVRNAIELFYNDPEFQAILEWSNRKQLNERKSYVRALSVIENNDPDTAARMIAERFPEKVAREFNILPAEVGRRIRELHSAKMALRRIRARFERAQYRRDFPPFRSVLDDFNQSRGRISREEQSTNDSTPDLNQFWH